MLSIYLTSCQDATKIDQPELFTTEAQRGQAASTNDVERFSHGRTRNYTEKDKD